MDNERHRTMSRRKNNLKRMKEARRERKNARKQKHGGELPSVTIVDKFSGEVRQGGPELMKRWRKDLEKERRTFLASTNPCYLIGTVNAAYP